MKRYLTTALILILFIDFAYSTEQYSDLLILGNDTIYLKSFPLESLHFEISPFKYGDYNSPSTACWRGYRATWKVIDEKLFLIDIIKVDSTNEKLDIEKYFKANNYSPKIINGLVFANWFSADLRQYPCWFGSCYGVVWSFNRHKIFDRVLIKFEKGIMKKNRFRKKNAL